MSAWVQDADGHAELDPAGLEPAGLIAVDGGEFATDLDKYYTICLGGTSSWRSRLKFWLLNSEFHCVGCFRLGQAAQRLHARNRALGGFLMFVYALWNRRNTVIHHTDIDRRARIGRGLLLMHRNGVFIGPAIIGHNCVIHHNVTIGQRIAGGDHGVPRIGNDVWIGPGVTLTGGISIGDGVTISAGTVLCKNVPDNCLVAGNPGRIIQHGYDNSAMINYTVGRRSSVPSILTE